MWFVKFWKISTRVSFDNTQCPCTVYFSCFFFLFFMMLRVFLRAHLRVILLEYSGENPGDYRELGYGGTEGAGVAGNGSLVIPRVSREHSGSYLCKATNGIGPGLSKLIQLTVHGKIFTKILYLSYNYILLANKG